MHNPSEGNIHGMDHNEITVLAVAGRRCCADVARQTRVIGKLECAGRDAGAFVVPCASGQARHAGGDVNDCKH